jgi:hypothetical protein
LIPPPTSPAAFCVWPICRATRSTGLAGMKPSFGARLARPCLLSMHWIVANTGKKTPFPCRRPIRTAALRARRVLTFERADRGITRRNGRGIACPSRRLLHFVKQLESDASLPRVVLYRRSLLDTNISISRGATAAWLFADHIAKIDEKNICTSIIVAAKLCCGAARRLFPPASLRKVRFSRPTNPPA